VILTKVAAGKDTYGYNAETSEYGGRVEMGILDPTTRYALQTTTSITRATQRCGIFREQRP